MSGQLFKHRKMLALAFLAAGTFFLMGYLESSQLPKLRSWALVKIEEVSRDHSPVKILPDSITIRLVPLGASLTGVKIAPKEELQAMLDPFTVERLDIAISPWQLLEGRLRVESIDISGANISVRIPTSKKASAKPLQGFFDLLGKIPVNRIAVNDVSVNAHAVEPNLIFDVAGINLAIEKRHGGLDIDLESAAFRTFDPETHSVLGAEAEARAAIGRDSITLAELKIRRGDSFLVASGRMKGDVEAFEPENFPKNFNGEINGSLRSELQLESMRNWAVKALPAKFKNIPPLKGRAFVEAKINESKGQEPEGDFILRTESFSIRNIGLDRISTAGTYHHGVMKLQKASLENMAGTATIEDGILRRGPEDQVTIEGKLKVPSLQLHDLLTSFGAKNVPVYGRFGGEVPCQGQIVPEFKLECKGKIDGQDLLVKDDMKSEKAIVEIKTFTGTGEATIDKDQVVFATELAMPDSKGRARGSVGFDTGFKIDYEADRLAIKDVAQLASLKLEGVAKVKGYTEGDTKSAWTSMRLDGTDMWLENFWLGNAHANIEYRAGGLSFTDLQGYYTVSRYNGDVRLDLIKKQIATQMRVPFFEVKDLLKVMSRKTVLPFTVTGSGQAQIKLSGPLEINHMTYDLKSTVYRGSVAGENFDQAVFDVKSVAGEVKTERVIVNKGAATVTMKGSAHPDGNIDTVVRGRGLHLEDTNFVANSGLALAGIVDFDMDMKGYVLGPDTDMRGTLSKAAIGDQALADSNFKLKFTAKTVEGSGNLLGEAIKTEWVFPLTQDAPYKLSLKTKDWNFAPIFALLGGAQSRKDYQGKLTSTIDLSAPTGGFWNSTGQISIPTFLLSRGSLALANAKPIAVHLNAGNIRVGSFDLEGDGMFLRVSDKPKSTAKMDLQIDGKLDLNLLSILTPFFEDFRGILAMTLNLRGGGGQNTALLGSAEIEKGYLKFFEFPHPFENIRADVLFNQDKVVFNSLKAELGGGLLSTNGSMEFKGYKNYPLNLNGTFDKVTLNVPDKVKTTGSGTISMSGNWFPFLLKGAYVINDGMVTKELGGDSSAAGSNIRRDNYLPDFLLQESFTPLLVDLHIDFKHGLPIKNELVEGKVLGAIDVKGQPTKPAITGVVTMDKDFKLNFKDNIFEVTDSKIEFEGGPEIDPKLFIAAQARVQEYDVNLIVQGTGSKPVFSLSSVPNLLEKDIISLLALGATDQDLDNKITSGNQASNTGMQVGSGVIKNNPLSKTIKNLGFDVQFSPGFDENTGTSQQKVIVKRQFNASLGVLATHSMGSTQETTAQVNYRLNDHYSLIGSWQDHETTDPSLDPTQVGLNPNSVGLDVEYKFGFK